MPNSNESVSRIFRQFTGQEEPEPEVVEETVELEPEPESDETQESEPVKIPSSAWLKADIVTWLGDNGATVDEEALNELTKTELLELVESLTD
jgi:hypothetical protein